MRWQCYGFDSRNKDFAMDLTKCSLETLYDMERKIETYLDELRKKEPSTKRKNEREHSVWFMQCACCIDDLKEVRDAIVVVKNASDKDA